MKPDITYHDFEVVIITSLIAIATYTFLSYVASRMGKKEIAANKSNEIAIHFQRISGAIIFLLVPLLASPYLSTSSAKDWGVALLNPVQSAIWFLSLGLLVVIGSHRRAKTPANLSVYPQIRVRSWNVRLYFLSGLTWAAYLLSYEFFFRGFLLFACEQVTGITIAITINVFFYALIHIPKGKFETIGAVPLGIILCLITYSTGSFWTSFGIHLCMALSNEWMSVYYFMKDSPNILDNKMVGHHEF